MANLVILVKMVITVNSQDSHETYNSGEFGNSGDYDLVILEKSLILTNLVNLVILVISVNLVNLVILVILLISVK